MLRKLIFASFFLALAFSQKAQNGTVKKNGLDTAEINLSIRLADRYRANDVYAAIKLAQKAINDAHDINYPQAIVRGNIILGKIQEDENKTPAAYKYYQRAYRIALDLKDSSLLSSCFLSIGVVYKRLEAFPKSVEYLSKALKYSNSKNSTVQQRVNCQNVLGHVNMDWFERTKDKRYYHKALENYYEAHDRAKANKLESYINNGYVNLANAHMLFYKIFGDGIDIKTSITNSYEGLTYCDKVNQPDWKAIHYLNIGEANYAKGSNDSAVIYCKKALEIHKRLNNVNWFEAINKDIAMAYKSSGDYENSTKYILEAIACALKYHGSPMADDYRILSELYTIKKNYAGALDAYKSYKRIENKNINEQQIIELERVQVGYESDIKDKEIAYLNQEKRIVEEKLSRNKTNIALTITLLILIALISVFLIFYNRSLKRAKELADNARIMQEQFLANTSHEIRTPMNGIQGMVNLLQDSPLNETQKQQLQTIKNSSNHLLRIINDLLDLSKIKAGKIELFENNFDLENVVHIMSTLMGPMAVNKGLAYNVQIEDSAKGMYFGDDMRLEQILINLLSNAIKYTEKGEVGLVVYGIEKEGNEKRLYFKVTDTGIGIPKKMLDIIFESFVQVETAGRRLQGGTGLGLSITKQLIELQNGVVKVHSVVGRGSEFEFYIPYKMLDGKADKKVTSNDKKKLNGRSILMIEDNEINQKVIGSTLRAWEANCTIVSSAVEGFDQLMNSDFDLILMDIELPVINGWDATQYIRLKFDAPKKNIPIIAITAYASEEEKKKCLASGMNDVVTKPIDNNELFAKIYKLLNASTGEIATPVEPSDGESFIGLEHKYGNDKKGLAELYHLYITELPVYLNELKALNEVSNIDGIKKQAHKMKSPLGLIGKKSILESLKQLQLKHILENDSQRKTLIRKIIRETEVLREDIVERLKNLQSKN